MSGPNWRRFLSSRSRASEIEVGREQAMVRLATTRRIRPRHRAVERIRAVELILGHGHRAHPPNRVPPDTAVDVTAEDHRVST